MVALSRLAEVNISTYPGTFGPCLICFKLGCFVQIISDISDISDISYISDTSDISDILVSQEQ